MAKPQRKDKNAWDRFLLWAEENQKVIWVVLLLLLAPSFAMTGIFQQGCTPSADSAIVAKVAGQTITQANYRRTKEGLLRVESLLGVIARDYNPLPGPLAGTGLSWAEMDVVQFYAYRDKALKMGIRVPDEELAEYIRELWQRYEAQRRASEDLSAKPEPAPGDQNAMYQRYFERIELARKKLDALRAGDGKAFDAESWAKVIEGSSEGAKRRAIVSDFEETLREICIVAKLEGYVKSSVRVSPQEVFESFNKEKSKRKLSWTELKAPDALKEKLAKSLTADDLKAYYESSKESFKKGLSLKTSWLLLPLEHFKAEAEKAVTEDDLKKYYHDNRQEYRKPALLSEETDFAVRKPEEKAALETQLYKPFDDVKEKVRERVIELRSQSDMSALAGQLAQRLYPAKPATDKPAVSFDELVKELPYLKAGTTAFIEQQKAKEALGDAYSTTLETWFRTAMTGKPINVLKTAVRSEKGQLFYMKPETRPAQFLPQLREVEAEAREQLARQKAVELIEKAARTLSGELNAGKKDLAAASTGVDVELAGEKIHIDATPPQTSSTYIAKEGSIMVPKKKPEKPDEKKPVDDEDDPGEDANEEPLPASKTLVEAVFKLPESDKLQTTVVSDEAAGACYIARFEDFQLPNPASFEKQKDQLERKLVQENSQLYFAKWRTELLKETRG